MKLSNPTGRKTEARVLTIGEHELFFSYETLIAYRGPRAPEGVRATNVWGRTTARHMRLLCTLGFSVVHSPTLARLAQEGLAGFVPYTCPCGTVGKKLLVEHAYSSGSEKSNGWLSRCEGCGAHHWKPSTDVIWSPLTEKEATAAEEEAARAKKAAKRLLHGAIERLTVLAQGRYDAGDGQGWLDYERAVDILQGLLT